MQKSTGNNSTNNNQTGNISIDKNDKAVDLGLSVKWANYNVGASSPEEYGGYYAWGETSEKSLNSDYNEDTYIYYNSGQYVNIGSDISGTQYDVVHVKWGGSWRMPTLVEVEELCEKCTWEWITYNGVNGQLVTGPNGNSVFFPAAGNRLYANHYNRRGSEGEYLSGSYVPSGSIYVEDAFHLYFDSTHKYGLLDRRYVGCSVRGVCPYSEN